VQINMASPSPPLRLTPSEGYRAWADSYDREANPMLSLEGRILRPLLPTVTGLDVVDFGCGTGRWLNALKDAGARSLFGVDPSQEMLDHARTKLGEVARLVCADDSNLQAAGASADLVLCNFVLSYITDAEQLLEIARRILRPGGSLFLTDVHPETAAALNWRRGVNVENEFKEIQTINRTIADVIALCKKADLELRLHLEPKFGDEEGIIFQQNGKHGYFDEIRERPAIYLLQLIAPEIQKKSSSRKAQRGIAQRIRSARFALGPSDSACGEIHIGNASIEAIGCIASRNAWSPQESGLNLEGYLILPGLINAHDHLEFALFPRLGKGGYQNFMEWAEDIHRFHAAEIARHRQVPKHVRLWWGGIRNVLCGATTVCHHNPYERVFSDEFIVRVLKDYEWAHSLQLEPDAARKKNYGSQGRPFFIHLAEGIDAQASKEIFDLHDAGALDADTVVIHGLALCAQGSELLRAAGAGLIWCPSSNLFLFGKSMSPTEIRQFPKVSLGSDSPLTAQGDLLDEISCAHQFMETPSDELYGYVTQQPACLLALKNGEGTIRIGGVADLIATRDTGLTPADTLSTLSYRDIELVLLAGRVQLASAEMKRRLPAGACKELQPLSIEGIVRWIRAPLNWLFEETQARLHGDIYLGGRQVSLGS
jgi:ubiquinone/menaquinone biosynthesis C-methylase UbiE/cytosine/adenosine deaminase-related metal-dependent hydrolase